MFASLSHMRTCIYWEITFCLEDSGGSNSNAVWTTLKNCVHCRIYIAIQVQYTVRIVCVGMDIADVMPIVVRLMQLYNILLYNLTIYGRDMFLFMFVCYMIKVPPIQYIHCERAHSVFYAPSLKIAPPALRIPLLRFAITCKAENNEVTNTNFPRKVWQRHRNNDRLPKWKGKHDFYFAFRSANAHNKGV